MRISAILFFLLFSLVESTSFLYAQDGNPRHPAVARFEEIGTLPSEVVWPLGDVNGDGIDDYATGYTPQGGGLNAIIHHGVKGKLAHLEEEGQPLTPEGVVSVTYIYAVGDWDGENGPDLCVRTELHGDTSFGNPGGYQIFRVVIFWNDGQGQYSIEDTSHVWPGIYMSFLASQATSSDMNGDGIEDLIIRSGGGYSWSPKYPKFHVYLGGAQSRWGRNGISNMPDWQWWNAPQIGRLDAEDLDLDGVDDIILYDRPGSGDRLLSVLYGRTDGAFPDTLTDLQQIPVATVGGWGTVFSDVTGDGIEDLTILNSSQSLVYVYVGCKGQRLLDQFGSGNDPPEGKRWWGKPWAAVKGPSYVNSVWFGLEQSGLFDLGSGDTNATEEVWVVSSGYLLCYDVGGRSLGTERYGLDSLFDGQVNLNPGGNAHLLGDIDGDGFEEFNVGRSIFRKVRQLPETMGSFWQVPQGKDTITSAPEFQLVGSSALELQVEPNPATEEVRIRWEDVGTGEAEISISDVRGREIRAFSVPVVEGEAVWDASGVAGGLYFVRVEIGARSSVVQVRIQ